MKPRSEMTMHCTLHCAACGAHFHGLSAFDRHRAGEYKQNGRYCVDPATLLKDGKPRMQGTAGLCDKMPGCWADGKHVKDEPATIWQEI